MLLKKIISQMEEALNKEMKMGCSNASVFGGFAQYITSTVRPLAEDAEALTFRSVFVELQELAGAYREQSPIRRREILERMNLILAGIKTEDLPERERTAKSGLSAHSVPDSHLTSGVRFLKNVGPKRVELFARLGIHTIGDLLEYFPRRYEDRRQLKKISQLAPGQAETISGSLIRWEEKKPRPKLSILQGWIKDETGMIPAVWFNQPYIKKQIPVGSLLLLHGKVEKKYHQAQLLVQDFEINDDAEGHDAARIVSVYPATDRLPQKVIQKTVEGALTQYGNLIQEPLPADLIGKYGLMTKREAVFAMHLPQSTEEQSKARHRLAFEEFLILQLGVLGNAERDLGTGIRHSPDPEIWQDFQRALPFPLTGAQIRVAGEIYRDMESQKPMSRLVQGDVGSGKTAVAAAALLKTVRSGFQGAMMAPTEILAGQHFSGLSELLGGIGVRVALLTGRTPAGEREKISFGLLRGEVDVLVGTHTLIQDKICFRNLGLAVTDEQHRFGVMQRVTLREKGQSPDILVMTATPIPRTLALSLYGDLDLSVIDEMPPGRKEIKTYAVDYAMEARIFAFIKKEIDQGRQAYVVCPLVEESETLDLQAATALAAELEVKFDRHQVALLHGRMKGRDKEKVMDGFRAGKVQILVSTTVVEVGINVPNASVMLIRDAERFGLAQLHQLRGRIGRGSSQSYCILMHHAASPLARERMKIMEEIHDGFKIAEADLTLRGPGDFFGTRQHGLPELKTANIFEDAPLLEKAREAAQEILREDPHLESFAYSALGAVVREKFRMDD